MRNNSELMVITKAKDLLQYIIVIAENAPKKFRFTITGRLINTASDGLEQLILANEEMLGSELPGNTERRNRQHKALAYFKVLDAFAMTARECGCITPKQHEVLSEKIYNCIYLTAGWINSDKKRMQNETKV